MDPKSALKTVRMNFLLVLPLLIGIAGCTASSSKTSSSSGTTVTPPASATYSCTTAVVDSGQKGIVTSVARGTYSDVQMIPGTARPTVAYNDAGTLTLKFNYWTGSSFVTEIISGDGSASFVKLAYLSSGVPLVFWIQGTNVKMAMRSAALSTAAASWSAGIIDTGTAPRALEVSVNPVDQVGVVFVTDTAVAGRVKFLYCDAPCSGPSSFQTMTSTPYIENTNVIAATTSSGISWCKASETSYFPAVSYTVTGATKYAVCQNSLSSCLANTNWSLQSVAAVGATSSKLVLNSSTVGDTPKVMLLGASGLTPYKMGTTACTSAPAAFSAGAAIGGASSGTQWQKVVLDSTGKFHMIANEGTTSVRYYNSQTTSFNGAWNTAGTVETITVPALSSGGIAYDSGTQTVYVSYPQGAAPFDLRLGRVQDITVSSNTATFVRSTPDTTGGLQLVAATSQLANASASSTSTGTQAIAYSDYSIGAVASGKLKYAIQNSATNVAEWNTVFVPGTMNPEFPSLAFDESNHPWISYFDASNNRFYLVTNNQTDGGGTWASYEFPATPTGAPAALPMANQVAVAMLYSAGVASPVMIVADNASTGRGLKSAVFNASTQAWSAVTTIDSIASGASHLSVDFTTSGTIILGYRDLLSNKAKYVTSTNGTSWGTPLMLGAVGQGAGLSVRLNSYNGHPSVSYFDRANNSVYYAECSGTPAACATAGWTSTLVDSSAGVSGLVAGNEQLLSTSISFDAAGIPTVYYPTGQTSLGSLRSAVLTAGAFVLSTVNAGKNGNLSGTPAVNFAVSGWGLVATTNSSHRTLMSYTGPGNWLYATSCGY